MLKSLQIQDVKVQEVFSLDDDMLQFLPKPVFGLIFLFQFQEDTTLPQEQTCPDHVWFANQTTSNACASIALLNIIMNASISDIGPVLTEFKNYSMPLTPAVRGLAVSNHETIRQTHNCPSHKTRGGREKGRRRRAKATRHRRLAFTSLLTCQSTAVCGSWTGWRDSPSK
jgi:ubiquitin carboxyl-terminal hydrolase L5